MNSEDDFHLINLMINIFITINRLLVFVVGYFNYTLERRGVASKYGLGKRKELEKRAHLGKYIEIAFLNRMSD